jgi:hypothetical protein
MMLDVLLIVQIADLYWMPFKPYVLGASCMQDLPTFETDPLTPSTAWQVTRAGPRTVEEALGGGFAVCLLRIAEFLRILVFQFGLFVAALPPVVRREGLCVAGLYRAVCAVARVGFWLRLVNNAKPTYLVMAASTSRPVAPRKLLTTPFLTRENVLVQHALPCKRVEGPRRSTRIAARQTAADNQPDEESQAPASAALDGRRVRWSPTLPSKPKGVLKSPTVGISAPKGGGDGDISQKQGGVDCESESESESNCKSGTTSPEELDVSASGSLTDADTEGVDSAEHKSGTTQSDVDVEHTMA